MDDLDREIEEAARAARRRVWRGRFATIASTATFFIVGIVGLIVVLAVFPEPRVSEFDARRNTREAQNGESVAVSIAGDFSAQADDHIRMRTKLLPVLALAMGSAVFVAKRLKPRE
jgi:hypothetical protein